MTFALRRGPGLAQPRWAGPRAADGRTTGPLTLVVRRCRTRSTRHNRLNRRNARHRALSDAGRYGADLRHERERVEADPLVGDPAVAQIDQRHPGELDALARRLAAEERPGVRA